MFIPLVAAGGLKIKMFSKMKEKNAIDNIKKDDDGEEDFDLGSSNQDPTPQAPVKSKVKVEGTGGSKLLSKLQSSTISITPVSQQQQSAKPPGNIHLPAGVTLTSQTKSPFSKPPNNKSSSAPTKSVLRPKVHCFSFQSTVECLTFNPDFCSTNTFTLNVT